MPPIILKPSKIDHQQVSGLGLGDKSAIKRKGTLRQTSLHTIMFITVKAVRGIQGRVHAGSAEIARRVGNRRVPKRSLNARSLTLCPTIMTTISTRFLQGSSSSSSTAKTQRKSRAAFSTAGQAGQGECVLSARLWFYFGLVSI